jgi:hypothetical protein
LREHGHTAAFLNRVPAFSLKSCSATVSDSG